MRAGIDDEDEELQRPLVRSSVLFDAAGAERATEDDRQRQQQRQKPTLTEMPRAVQAAQERDVDDVWAELG